MTKISHKAAIVFLILTMFMATPDVAFGQSINSKIQSYWEETLYKFGIIKQIKPVFPEPITNTVKIKSENVVVPKITETSPKIVSVGKIVTINGSGFKGLSASNILIENGAEIPHATILPNKITFVTPNIKDGVYNLSILGTGGESNTVKLSVTKNIPKTVNKINNSVPRNTNTNNSNNSQYYQPNINADFRVPAIEQEEYYEIDYNTQYTNQDQDIYWYDQSEQDQVEFFPPRVVKVTPSRAKMDDVVEVLGVNLSGSNTEVQILKNGSVVARPSIVSSNENKILFKVPSIAAEDYQVVIKHGGTISNVIALTIFNQITVIPEVPVPSKLDTPPVPVVVQQDLNPKIVSISPTKGSFGTVVTLSGTNFTGVTSDLLFITNTTGSIGPEIISSSATSITFKVPNIPAGTYKIYLVADSGISNEVDFSVFIPENQTSNVLDWFLGLF